MANLLLKMGEHEIETSIENVLASRVLVIEMGDCMLEYQETCPTFYEIVLDRDDDALSPHVCKSAFGEGLMKRLKRSSFS